ncbi:hypothetical protein SAMN05444851_1631 [Aliiroseovarius sediminilitoris]|uniref:DUF192 domain-containing protein n=1 Tax=Aliiroseovarius sediminilitoris TaxID=1173584 RepID=A0A1I0PGZ5_9RHOB|nr:DUF192 domain-containing protein [Aliiroseovarius sediminilitoris]SEW13609.1 hypothetical protein SAMN05444851_1631 [Aliiroseovarius sediminilitoris]
MHSQFNKVLRLGASVICAFLLSGPAFAGTCGPDHVDLRGDWGKARFTVEIADDPGERAQGLMNRESLPMSHGMLFLFDKPQPVSFWMKNTLIPLDMLFLTADGTVARVHENAIPLDLSPIPGGSDILAVLEVNGGIAERFGITEGTELRHPLLDQSIASWPCAAAE